MQVLLDLRPQHLVKLQETKVDAVRLVCILLLSVFILLSIFNLGFTALELSNAQSELAAAQSELSGLRSGNNRLNESLKTMRDLREQTESFIELIRQDIPTVEFLAALEAAVPDGLKIQDIEMRENNVMMKGTALTDQDIVDFGEKLGGMRYIVRRVDAPVTTRGGAAGGGGRGRGRTAENMQPSFSITCSILSLAEIANSEEGAAVE